MGLTSTTNHFSDWYAGSPLATGNTVRSACQPPASAGLGDVAFGDAQARVGDEVEIPSICPGKWRCFFFLIIYLDMIFTYSYSSINFVNVHV